MKKLLIFIPILAFFMLPVLFALKGCDTHAGMIIGTGGIFGPGTVTFDTWDNSPAQLTADFTPGTPAGDTYNLYYALSSAASLTTDDCVYLLLTSYDVGLTAFPTCTASNLSGCTATAGKISGITGSPYSINGPLTESSVYCARITGQTGGSESVLGSTTKYATAAAAHFQTSINGISDISTAGTWDEESGGDTGTESILCTAGTIHIDMLWYDGATGFGDLKLWVDGSPVVTKTDGDSTLDYSIAAGTHNIRITWHTDDPNLETLDSMSFQIPVP